MKKLTTFLVVLSVAFFSAGAVQKSEAQVKQRPGHNRGIDPAGKRGNDDGNLRKAGKDCKAAEGLMHKALPIYDGHRHRAMEITRFAMEEIRAALRYDKNHEARTVHQSVQERVAAVKGVQEEPMSHYSPAQIAESNKRMVRAGEALAAAKALLQAAPNDYGGHKADAIDLIDVAMQEIRQGLNSVGHGR